jgi:drug/metabolite transporter (DMT)-like permease
LRIITVTVGVLLAIVSGVVALLFASGFETRLVVDARVAAAGLLTFPVGTGLYYVTALAYGTRADIAAQFANVKPLFSIGIAAVIFREVLGSSDLLAIFAIAAGVAMMFVSAINKSDTGGRLSLALGLLLAAAWAAGEGFVRSASADFASADIAFSGLLASAAFVLAVLLSIVARGRWTGAPETLRERSRALLPTRAHGAFLIHGVLSFGLAYALFFQSIATIGLARSAMVTAFWPALAIAIRVWAGRRAGDANQSIGGLQRLAFVLFLLGSLIGLLA